MHDLPIMDYIAAAQARDVGIEQVASKNAEWMKLALIELQNVARSPDGWDNLDVGFTGESIRMMLTPRIGEPTSPNAYGALVMKAVRARIIEPTGRYVPMQSEGSHYRKTPQYLFTRV